MNTLSYSTRIAAPAERVWRTLVSKETYAEWTQAWGTVGQFRGEWKEGATIDFIDHETGGTRAVLEAIRPYDRIEARHKALIPLDGSVEDTSSEWAVKWVGTQEIYRLVEDRETTNLTVEMITHEDFTPMFNKSWPKALATIKKLAEV